jgi:CheY-like chemotaxis protein
VTTYFGKVLVIDDAIDDRLSLAEQLRSLRWLTETAPNGRTGIDAAMKGQPDVVISAIVLPDVQGVHYARTLRSCIEHDIVIVGLGGHGDAPGFDIVFARPIDVGALHTWLLARVQPTDDSERRPTTKIKKLSR